MTDERQSVIDRLRAFERRFTEIIDLIGERQRVTGPDKVKAQQLLKSLKADLGEEASRLRTVRGREKLNRTERTCYEPAILETDAEIRVKWNSVPGAEWSDNLFGARINLRHMLAQLERPEE